MPTIRRRLGFVVLAMLLALPGLGFAQAPPPPRPLEVILLAVTAPSLSSLKGAEDAWKVEGGPAADVLTKYAMTLAYIANSNPSDGLVVLESVPKEIRAAGPLRRLHVWLQLRLQPDEAVERRLENWVQDLKARSGAPPKAQDLEDVAFLARLLAYLEQVASREQHLTAQQSQVWRKVLESLPDAWRGDLASASAVIAEELQQRTTFVQNIHTAGKKKTELELADIQQRIKDLKRDETIAKGRLERADAALAAYVNQHLTRMKQLEKEAAPWVRERNALHKPIAPGRSSTKGLMGDALRRAQKENDDEEDEYEDELKEYQEKRAEIVKNLAPLEQEAVPIYRQKAVLEEDVVKLTAALQKIQMPIGGLTKIEQRITKQLADQSASESPANQALLRQLEAYSVISLSAEVDRVRQARK